MFAKLLFDKINAETESVLHFAQQACLRTRCNKNQCQSCLDECTTGALAINNRLISFNAEKCSACMRCVAVCPGAAFVTDLDFISILKKIQQNNQIFVLSCKKEQIFENQGFIHCLGALSLLLLAALNSLAKELILVDTTMCGSCINSHCRDKIKKSLEQLQDKVSVAGKPVQIRLISEESRLPFIDKQTAKRFFLKEAGGVIVELGKEALNKVSTKKKVLQQEKHKEPPVNSVVLQFAYDHCKDLKQREILLSFFHLVTIDAKCTLCPLCSGMCPTGALKRVRDDGEKQLVFRSGDCSGCGLCQDFCKKKAILVKSGFRGDPTVFLKIEKK